MPDRQGTGVNVLLPSTPPPLLPSALAPRHPRSGTNLRVDFIELGRYGLEDTIQRSANDRNGKCSDDDPFQNSITGVISEHSWLVSRFSS